MIQGHIKSLLYAYDCVIIPDFGGLITHYAPAKIHPVKHTFSPPFKRVAFNEQLKVNDGLLISTFAKKQQVPLSQAQLAVSEFVQDLKEQLLNQHRFELQDVGVFRYNTERKLIFESIESENFLEASFGLPDLVSKPIMGKEALVLRGKYKDQTVAAGKENPKPVGRFKRLFRIGASLVVGGLTLSAAYVFSLQNNEVLSSLNPISVLFEKEPTQTVPTAEETYAEQKVEENTAAYGVDTWESEPAIEEDHAVADDSGWDNVEEGSLDTPLLPEDKPLVEVEKKAPVESAKPTPIATAVKENEVSVVKPETKAPEVIKGTIKNKTGRFYVIMGVFTQEGYAKRNQNQLQKRGYSAKIVQPSYDQDRERVSVADYATAEEAYAALPELRTKINNELWVFNY